MLLLRFIHFMLGYVRFRASGDFPERFLNLLSHNHISVWNIRRRGDRIEGCVLIKDYKKMRKIRAKSGTHLKMISRRGFPFFVKKYRSRIGFVVGAALFFVVINFMALFIWSIDVQGNERVNKDDIVAALHKVGIVEGAKISNVDASNVRQLLLLEMPELSWAAINIEGTKVTVDVREVNIVPDKIKDDQPCNLKANRDGRILGHRVIEGQMVVQVGDAVIAGDLLVSGTLEHTGGETSLKHSSGEVFAETMRTISFTAPFNRIEKVRNGNVHTKKVFNFFGVQIPLYLGSVQGTYEKQKSTWDLAFGDEKLPISVVTAEFYETEDVRVSLDESGALEKARQSIIELEKDQLNGIEIISKEETVNVTDAGVEVIMNYICKENIAEEELISIDPR